jgi:uncharacterized protein YggE
MKSFILLFFAICFFSLSSGLSYAAQQEENQIVVSATGRVSVKPDMAEFGVLVKSIAKNADQAAIRTAEKYRAVQQALRAAGIPAEDIPTANYVVAPQWEWVQPERRRELKGYAAQHLVIVKVRHLALTGKAIDAAVRAGADEVQQIIFSSSRHEELRREALASAVSNARVDAEIMAKAAGGRLGGAIELTVGQPVYRPVPSMDMISMHAATPEAVSPTEITPAEQDIRVTVSSRWRFLQMAVK